MTRRPDASDSNASPFTQEFFSPLSPQTDAPGRSMPTAGSSSECSPSLPSSPNIGSKEYWLQKAAASNSIGTSSRRSAQFSEEAAELLKRRLSARSGNTLPGARLAETPSTSLNPPQEHQQAFKLGQGLPDGTYAGPARQVSLSSPERCQDAAKMHTSAAEILDKSHSTESPAQKPRESTNEVTPDIGSKEYWLQKAASLKPASRRGVATGEETAALLNRRISDGRLPTDGPVWSELRAKIDKRRSTVRLREVDESERCAEHGQD